MLCNSACCHFISTSCIPSASAEQSQCYQEPGFCIWAKPMLPKALGASFTVRNTYSDKIQGAQTTLAGINHTLKGRSLLVGWQVEQSVDWEQILKYSSPSRQQVFTCLKCSVFALDTTATKNQHIYWSIGSINCNKWLNNWQHSAYSF